MRKHKVSIVTRTKDRKLLLPRALESVLAQTFPDWELIIVNDGGRRGELDELLGRYQARFDGRLNVIHHEQSVGAENAASVGATAARGDYVVIHDDDDSWYAGFLAACVAFLDDPAHVAFGGVVAGAEDVEEAIEDGRIVEKSATPFNPWLRSISLFQLASRNLFSPISFVYRRSLHERIGYYRQDLAPVADWDFHLRVAAACDIGVIPTILSRHHVRTALMAGMYANTVVAERDKHLAQTVKIRNERLRQDLETGAIGTGILTNLADDVIRAGEVPALIHQLWHHLDVQAAGQRTLLDSAAHKDETVAQLVASHAQLTARHAHVLQELDASREQVRALERIVEKLNESLSFKLGMSATAPLRWLASRVGATRP